MEPFNNIEYPNVMQGRPRSAGQVVTTDTRSCYTCRRNFTSIKTSYYWKQWLLQWTQFRRSRALASKGRQPPAYVLGSKHGPSPLNCPTSLRCLLPLVIAFASWEFLLRSCPKSLVSILRKAQPVVIGQIVETSNIWYNCLTTKFSNTKKYSMLNSANMNKPETGQRWWPLKWIKTTNNKSYQIVPM